MSLPPAMVFPIDTTGTDVEPYVGAGCLRGWSFQETTGLAGAQLVIYDGLIDSDVIVVAISLAANESTRDYPAGNGILLRTGCTIQVVSGSIFGSVWINPITHADDLDFAFGQSGPHWLRPGA